MPLFSYVAGAATLLAGALIVLQPDSPSTSSGTLSSWPSWLFQSHPSPPYANLPLFGVPADVRLRPSHFLLGTGLHRRYRLELEIASEQGRQQELEACRILAEWTIDRNFIIDQWLLHRHSSVRWTFVGQPVDLEVPAYSPRAAPFTVVASLPLKEALVRSSPGQQVRQCIEIPDIVPRYQMPLAGGAGGRSDLVRRWIQPPRLSLDCEQSGMGEAASLLMKVEEGGSRFKALSIDVPVAMALPAINHATYSLVSASLLYLLYHLYKA